MKAIVLIFLIAIIANCFMKAIHHCRPWYTLIKGSRGTESLQMVLSFFL